MVNTAIYKLIRCFPENTSFFTVCLFDLASPMIMHPPSIWELTLVKIDFASVWHLEEKSQVLETSSKIVLFSSCPPIGKQHHMVKI